MIIRDNEFVDLPTPTGPMRTQIVRPVAPGKYPGLVLFSEIFQITGPIRRTAALLAGHGYMVAVPGVFHELDPAGTGLAYDQGGAERGDARKGGQPISAYGADGRAGLEFLPGHADCTGGAGVAGVWR